MRNLRVAVGLLLFALMAATVWAEGDKGAKPQESASTQLDPELARQREQALALWRAKDRAAAYPLFEKIGPRLPKDFLVQEAWADCVLQHATVIADAQERIAERQRARRMYLDLQKNGDDSDVVKVMIASIPVDGRDPVFSDDKAVNEEMQEGEKAYSKGDFPLAILHYRKALDLNPKLYSAALFVGDSYYTNGDSKSATEWYPKAVAIDPDRETAYRYWGDALLKLQRYAEAREKFIQAILCDPYDQHVWAGASNYLRAAGVKPYWRRVKSPNSVKRKDSKNTDIVLDASALSANDGSSAWMIADMSRGMYKEKDFAKDHPKEKTYRDSLAEVSSYFDLVVDAAEGMTKDDKKLKLNEDLAFLVKLKKAGLLEAYILIAMADAGVAQDYKAYRTAHRELLERYLKEIVIPPPTR